MNYDDEDGERISTDFASETQSAVKGTATLTSDTIMSTSLTGSSISSIFPLMSVISIHTGQKV